MLGNHTTAQTITHVLNNPLQDFQRREQLLQVDSMLKDLSFAIRPLAFGNDNGKGITKPFIQLQPFQFIQQFNSRRPLQYNDGSMFATRGWQFHYTAGLKLQYKNITALLNPEFSWAYNPDFPGFPTDHYNIIWREYYKWLNKIDQPERMNGMPISRILPGQSRIQYALKGLALGVSTENLWWGPGRFHSLLMTNQAPGFLHYTLNTIRPLKTPIGTFEGQLVWGGQLPSSGIRPQETQRAYEGQFLYSPKDSIHPRILTGGVISWQPRGIKGLFIGLDAASIRYRHLQQKPAVMGSLFVRYAMPEEKAEVYFQYGSADRLSFSSAMFSDTIPQGYVAGFHKLFRLSSKENDPSCLELGIELIQMQLTDLSLITNARSWYTHPVIRQGFTNRGEVLGSYAGPGGNAQRFDVSYIRGRTRIGLEWERRLHNADFYYAYNYLTGSMDYNRQWVDLMTSLVWNFPIRNGLLFGQFSAIRSVNYQWKSYIPQPVTADTYFDDGWDDINLHARMGLKVDLHSSSGRKQEKKK
jgi:hypothetical protein